MKRLLLFVASLWLGIMGASAKVDHCDINGNGEVSIDDVIAVINCIIDWGHPGTSTGEVINLGLPSGTKWASCNVGATKPEEYGEYYAWGETEEKETYTWDNYIHCYGSSSSCYDLGKDICGTEYDVAHVKWGENWCMPTADDIKELYDNCTSEWTTLNGVKGRKFTSKLNGNSIFLPAAGSRGNSLSSAGNSGYYWSSTQNYYSDKADDLIFYSYSTFWNANSIRCGGRSVRPVMKANAQDYRCDVNGDGEVNIVDVTYVVDHILGKGHARTPVMEAIDLGLPSGTKWASCNIGAFKPEEYGGFYAWGETEEKDDYTWENYIHCDGSEKTCYNLGDIGGTKYDVAHVKWGGNWRLPSSDDIKELLDNCTHKWTTLNGVKGRRFTSNLNGNSIFLPASGYRYAGGAGNIGIDGQYLSTLQNPDTSYLTYIFYFNSGCAHWAYDDLVCMGQNVRPVLKP